MPRERDNPLRVNLSTLPPREQRTSDQTVQNSLKSIVGQKGAPCKRTCDCAFGLVCSNGACTEEW